MAVSSFSEIFRAYEVMCMKLEQLDLSTVKYIDPVSAVIKYDKNAIYLRNLPKKVSI